MNPQMNQSEPLTKLRRPSLHLPLLCPPFKQQTRIVPLSDMTGQHKKGKALEEVGPLTQHAPTTYHSDMTVEHKSKRAWEEAIPSNEHAPATYHSDTAVKPKRKA